MKKKPAVLAWEHERTGTKSAPAGVRPTLGSKPDQVIRLTNLKQRKREQMQC